MEDIKPAQEEGYFCVGRIEGRGVCGLIRMAFTIGLAFGINDIGYTGRYCYANLADAVEAISNWDGKGDPGGPWIKYKGFGGERRNELHTKTIDNEEV